MWITSLLHVLLTVQLFIVGRIIRLLLLWHLMLILWRWIEWPSWFGRPICWLETCTTLTKDSIGDTAGSGHCSAQFFWNRICDFLKIWNEKFNSPESLSISGKIGGFVSWFCTSRTLQLFFQMNDFNFEFFKFNFFLSSVVRFHFHIFETYAVHWTNSWIPAPFLSCSSTWRLMKPMKKPS